MSFVLWTLGCLRNYLSYAEKVCVSGGGAAISVTGHKMPLCAAVENGKGNQPGPAVLHAYDASDLARELYNSGQTHTERDYFGTGNKFIAPMIAHGKVYVGTTDGVGVFGLLPGF